MDGTITATWCHPFIIMAKSLTQQDDAEDSAYGERQYEI